MSKTPRTDKEAFCFTTGAPKVDGVVMADFARDLERENAALREALEDIAESTPAYHNAADFQRAYVWCKEQARAAFEGGAK